MHALLAFAALLAALALPATAVAAGAAPPPRLVVLLVIDGLPQRQLLALRDQLAPDGLARFLERGAWFAEAYHGQAYTLTAPGHAAMLTGAHPSRSGIIGNEWRDPATGAPVYNSGDAEHGYIGHATGPLDGTSPANLQAESLGDVLRRANPASKVLAVSAKDRGAILPAGRAGTAYMYMAATGRFASSSYYMQRHPAWVEAFNAARPADRWFRAEWKPLLPEPAYARSAPDGQAWFGPAGGKLPMRMAAPADPQPGPRYYKALLGSPFGDALTLDFARAAEAGEQLGQDTAPDLLVVSLSGHDYVNHRYSAESRISHDHLLQVDRLLAGFFEHLDSKVGAGNYLAALTSDHGFMPSPEFSQSKGLPAGRLASRELLARINSELEFAFGVPNLAPWMSGYGLLLDRQAIARRGLEFDTVAQAARDQLLAQPGIAAAYTRAELMPGSRASGPFLEALRKSWHAQRSPDLQFVLKPHWMLGSAVATHGSPHAYDAHVPLMLWGPRWVKAGRIDRPVEIVDLAPTLAGWLRVPAPAQSEGRALPLPAR